MTVVYPNRNKDNEILQESTRTIRVKINQLKETLFKHQQFQLNQI